MQFCIILDFQQYQAGYIKNSFTSPVFVWSNAMKIMSDKNPGMYLV